MLNASETFELMLIEGPYAEPFGLSELYLQTQAYQKQRIGVILSATTDLGWELHTDNSRLSQSLPPSLISEKNC